MAWHYQFNLLPHYLQQLFTQLRIAVIYGGDKSQPQATLYPTHNPRQWKSYRQVAEDIKTALMEIGFQQVYCLADDLSLYQTLQQHQIHFAWLNTGGMQGYNPMSHTPGILEMLGIPYVGHNPLNSSILDNKHVFKRELQGMRMLGIRTAPFIVWDYSSGFLEQQIRLRFAYEFGDYQGPFVVKPVSGRASHFVCFVERIDQLAQVANEVYQATHNHILIERYLPGREFCVAVCGTVLHQQGALVQRSQPFVFSKIERIFEPGERIFASMDAKPINSTRANLMTPGEDEHIQQELDYIGQTIYQNFFLKSIVRIDLRLDEHNHLHILEVNPKPDLQKPTPSSTSLICMGIHQHQLSYNDLIFSLLADRLNYLFAHRANLITHITQLLTL